MIKKRNYLLFIIPIILLILLVINISIYNTNKNKNNKLITNINNYQEDIKKITYNKEELNNQLEILKEKNQDKIWEYVRWIKWNKEIKEKID